MHQACKQKFIYSRYILYLNPSDLKHCEMQQTIDNLSCLSLMISVYMQGHSIINDISRDTYSLHVFLL